MPSDNLLKNYSRRNFIKTAGSLGAVITGSILSNDLLAKNYPHIGDANSHCKFTKLATDFIYLNSGTEGSMPECVIKEFTEKVNQWASNPTFSYEKDKDLGKHQHSNRKKIADFLSVNKNNICLTDNTTMGLNMVLMGINFKATDKVIVTNHEHNAIISPLTVQKEKIGISIKTRDFPAAAKLNKMDSDELLEFLLPNTQELRGAKALCVSHVYPSTGTRLPLKALRKKADELGIEYLVVDGAQAFGMLDLGKGSDDIRDTDFYACPGHKWLNGPPSTGILYLKNADIKPPEFYPTLSQRMTKYTDRNSNFPMAEALQVRGCSNAPGFSAMLAAINFEEKLGGPKLIEKHILSLSTEIKEFINSQSTGAIVSPITDNTLSSGLTVFFPFSWNQPDKIFTDKKTAETVVTKLLKKNIQIRFIGFQDSNSSTKKSYALRVSTGLFNTKQQIQSFKEALQEVLGKL